MWKEKIKYIILFLAIVFIVCGINLGEMAEVLAKAINICLECCGIG